MLEILPTITFQVLKRLEALLKITIKRALNTFPNTSFLQEKSFQAFGRGF